MGGASGLMHYQTQPDALPVSAALAHKPAQLCSIPACSANRPSKGSGVLLPDCL